jgi:hypothetical protein
MKFLEENIATRRAENAALAAWAGNCHFRSSLERAKRREADKPGNLPGNWWNALTGNS